MKRTSECELKGRIENRLAGSKIDPKNDSFQNKA